MVVPIHETNHWNTTFWRAGTAQTCFGGRGRFDSTTTQQRYPNGNGNGSFGNQTGGSHVKKELEDEAIDVGDDRHGLYHAHADDDLKKMPVEQLSALQQDLQLIFDHLVVAHRDATYNFYAFWRNLVYKLLTSPLLPLKLFGCELVNKLIEAGEKHRPPPRTFWV